MTETKLIDIIDTLEAKAQKPFISLGSIFRAMQSRGFGPVILVPALLTLLPTGALPGVPGVCAIVIILAASQLMMGGKELWLPQWLKRRPVSRDKLRDRLEMARPFLRFTDKFFKARLEFMFSPMMEKIVAGLSILMAMTFFPLAIIPFAAIPPSAAVTLMALGLSARDGLATIAGIILSGFALFLMPAAAFN